MKHSLLKTSVFLLLITLSQALEANTNATWTGADSTDLNTAGNWSPADVPNGVATFDSNYPPANFTPTADSEFTIDSFYFPHSASAFSFTFTGPTGALDFTGIGIYGTYTNTQITATNDGLMTTPQIFFTPVSNSNASLGGSSLVLTNGPDGMLSFNNAAQLVLADIDSYTTVPITADNNVSILITNNGSFTGGNEAGQIFLKGSSFTVGDNFVINANNNGAGAIISSNSNTGQVVFDAADNEAAFSAGNNMGLSFSNGNNSFSGAISSTGRGNNVAQMLFDGKRGTASFTTGDGAALTFISTNGSTIENVTSGNDAGQMVFDGNNGIASFTAGDNATLSLGNQNNSTIQGLGFDAGQMVFDGDGGLASFTVGNNFLLSLSNGSTCTIQAGSDGNDAGQLLFDGNGATATFIAGDYGILNVSNGYSGTIASYYNTGQIVVDGDGGTASFTLGNNNSVNVINEGAIYNSAPGSLVAQIVFNGSQANSAGVSLNTGNNVIIKAINRNGGTIDNFGGSPSAQMYFSSATINGNPTLVAINENSNMDGIEGIVFDGTSTADNTNIVLENTSLVINTTNSNPFTIASLSGNHDSVVKLSNDFEINTVANAFTVFDGIISDASGFNNLIIDGSGTQVLAGANTYGGTTNVNGGNLVLTGSVVNDVFVNDGGNLFGTGIINRNLTINDGGTVVPGFFNHIGTLNINQNYNQNDGGTFIVLISDVDSSQLDIAGNATLAGTLEVASVDGRYSIGRPYTVLTAGSLTGTFDQVVPLNFSPFLDITTIYNQDPSVEIILSTDFTAGARTSNQRNVAKQIDGIPVPTSCEDWVINNLLSLPEDQLPYALDEMSGEQYTYLAEINQYTDYRFSRRIFDAVRDYLDPCACEAEQGNINTWAAFEGGYGRVKNHRHDGRFHEYNLDFSLGADKWCNCVLLGAAANFEENHLTFKHGCHNKLYNFQGSLYGVYTTPRCYVFSDLIVGGGCCHFKRKIEFADLYDTAHSRPKFIHGLLYAEWGWNVPVCGVLLQPFLAGGFGYIHSKEFCERRACSLNLHVKGHSLWSPNLYLGTHLSSSYNCIELNADLVYHYRFGSSETKLHTRFIDFGDTFTVKGRNYSRSGFLGNVNAAVNVAECAKLYVEFTGDWWSHRYNYSGAVGLICTW